MGAWGTDVFENDAACDWSYDLAEKGMAHIHDALSQVLETEGDYLDADLGSEGLAACDVVARLAGNPGQQDAYTETVDVWVAEQSDPPSEALVTQALQVIDRVLAKGSELAELWDEDGEDNEWRDQVAALRKRLTA